MVLLISTFFAWGGFFISGVLADRFGAKPLIAVGMIVRAVGFGAMGFATTYPVLMTTAIVAAVGGALFESPRSAAIAALTDERERSSYF
ncbi:MAG: major facilitator superfamily 1, partial [Thermomicrobiales bacterium]|nr:major facilitator superfamily 1 [Thermomicrobiales bacterium]